MEQLKSRLSTVITVLPICVAVLFLAGSSMESAFLRGLGLSPAQFPSSFENTALGGFNTLLVSGAVPLLYFIAGLGLVCIAAFAVIQVLRARHSKGARKVKSQAAQSKIDAADIAYLEHVASFSDQLVNWSVVVAGLIISVFVLSFVCDHAGSTAADRFKQNAAAGKSVVSEIYSKSSAAVALRGVLAACNGVQCAYWVNDHSVIVNMGDVDRVESKPIIKPNTNR